LQTSSAVDVMVIKVLTQVWEICLTQLARHSDVNSCYIQEYDFVLTFGNDLTMNYVCICITCLPLSRSRCKITPLFSFKILIYWLSTHTKKYISISISSVKGFTKPTMSTLELVKKGGATTITSIHSMSFIVTKFQQKG
jgi:hypothetical protein